MISNQDAQLTPSSIVCSDDEAAHTTNPPSHSIKLNKQSTPSRSARSGWSFTDHKALTSLALLIAFGPTGAEARTGVEIAEIILIPVLVIISGILAGLTLGYLSLDMTALEVLSRTGTPKQRAQAKKVIPIRKDGHLLLITLLMANMIVNEALPIIADPVLGGGVQAVVVSTVLIIIFAEIIPQSVCSRFGLAVGSTMVIPVKCLIFVFFPVSWPVAKLLTYLLGPHAGVVYRRTELKELVAMHAEMGGHGGDLNTDVVTIMGATLDLQIKSVRDAMTPMKDVFQLPITSKLDYETLGQILKAGHSRIPVYEEVPVHSGDSKQSKRRIIGVLLTKQLILLDPEDATPLRNIPMNVLPTVDENLSLLQILNTFQEGRSHMAIAHRRKPVINPLTGEVDPTPGGNSNADADAEKAELEMVQEEKGIRSLFHRKRKGSKSSKDSSSDDEADHSDETANNTAQNEKIDRDAHASQVSVNTLYAIEDEFPVGLITLEDVLEELLGEEIYDETDDVVHEDGSHGVALQPYIPPEAVGRLGPPPAPSTGAAAKGATTPTTQKSGMFGRFGKQMVRSRSAPGKSRTTSGVESGSGSGSDSKATTPSGSVTPSNVLTPGSATPLTAEPAGMTEPESLTNIAEDSTGDSAAGRPSILKKADPAGPSASGGPEKAVTIASSVPSSSGTPPPATAGTKVPGLLSDAILLERGRRLLVAEGADPKALPPMRLATSSSRPASRSATPSGGVRVLSVPTPTTAQATAQVSGTMPMSGAVKGPKGVFKSPALQGVPVRSQPGSKVEGTSAAEASGSGVREAQVGEEKKE